MKAENRGNEGFLQREQMCIRDRRWSKMKFRARRFATISTMTATKPAWMTSWAMRCTPATTAPTITRMRRLTTRRNAPECNELSKTSCLTRCARKTAASGKRAARARLRATSPVSYTHLDVYKRQVYEQSRRLFLSEFSWHTGRKKGGCQVYPLTVASLLTSFLLCCCRGWSHPAWRPAS